MNGKTITQVVLEAIKGGQMKGEKIYKHPMHKHIRSSNHLAGIDHPIADKTSEDAWDWLIDQPLNKQTVCGLQKRIVSFQNNLKPAWIGKYRGDNDAFKRYPNYTEVASLMNQWFNEYQTLDPMDAHIRFMRIHPLAAANGRVGRMLIWYDQSQRHVKLQDFRSSRGAAYYRKIKGE